MFTRSRTGYTLSEMLVVGIIILFLTSMTAEVVGKVKANSLSAECTSRLRQVGAGILMYKQDFGDWPTFEPPYGLGDSHNWKDLWGASDLAGMFFATADYYGEGVEWGNRTTRPRVPRILEEYAGSVAVLHCPSQGASAYWPDTGPFYYNAASPWDTGNTTGLWITTPAIGRKYHSQALVACQNPVNAAAVNASWRHGTRLYGNPKGENNHLLIDQSVKIFLNPANWKGDKQ